jgi:hypothetical protein
MIVRQLGPVIKPKLDARPNQHNGSATMSFSCEVIAETFRPM